MPAIEENEDDVDSTLGSTEDTKDNDTKKGEVDPDTEAALSLYHSLKDPELGREVVETLARKLGLLDSQSEKPVSEDKQESLAKKVLKSKLGKDFDKFSDMVGPALDEIIQTYLGAAQSQNQGQTLQASWESNVDKFMEQYSLTPEIEREMQSIIADSPPAIGRRDFNAQKYLARIYRNAVEELGIKPEPKKSQLREVMPGDFVVRERPKTINMDDAIEAAMKGIRFK